MITEVINGGRVFSSILIADLLSFGNLDFFSEFIVVDNFLPENDSIYSNIMNKTYYFWKIK